MITEKVQKKAFSRLLFLLLFLVLLIVFAITVYFVKQFLYHKKLDLAIMLTKSSPVNHIDGSVLWVETVNNNFLINQENKSLVYIWQNKPKGSFAQTNKNNQPIYTLSGINNLPALYFDKKMFMVDLGFQNITQATTIFAVTKPTVAIGKKPILSKANNQTNFKLVLNMKKENYHYEFCLFADKEKCFISQEIQKTSEDEVATQIVSVVANSYNNNKSGLQLFINGNLLSSFTTTDSFFADSKTALNIGRTVNENEVVTGYFDGYIGEIIIYNKALSALQRKLIEDYLKKKWLE
jgi:hypothetical protein